jgi:FtsH-binding integral membrane protein
VNYSSPYTYGVVSDAPDQVRSEFIRRVYNLFFVSMLITVGAGYFAAQPAIMPAVLGMLPALLIGGLVVGLVMAFTQRKPGVNVAMLILYSVIQGAIAGPLLLLLNRFAPGIPMQAMVLTVTVFGGLSFYAATSKKDFSFLGGFLTIAVLGLIGASVVMFFFQTPLLSMVYSVAGILIFSAYILYDTSNIMNRLGPDEVASGAISLYLDFINLFWFILRLLMELNRRD